jgi:hypothetical protein
MKLCIFVYASPAFFSKCRRRPSLNNFVRPCSQVLSQIYRCCFLLPPFENLSYSRNVNPKYCHTIITPTKCTLLLLKAPDITICTFLSYILPLRVSTRMGYLQGAQCQCLAKVIINYNLLKLR